ncbi:MAG: VRR-NUC domain-containing protein [Roseburia sp.]|nr:VRR-NUC domain-containing protein [Roseburia sp.]
MYESAFEKKLCDHIKSLGGKAYKWVSPGTRGVPDRIAILPGGKVIFIEVKRPGLSDGLSVRQKKVREKLETLGCAVWRISDMDDLKERLREYGV